LKFNNKTTTKTTLDCDKVDNKRVSRTFKDLYMV